MSQIEEIQKVFAKRLVDLIEDKGLNQSLLSKEIQIPRTTINNWLNFRRKPQMDALFKLADFFKVSIDYLLGRESY